MPSRRAFLGSIGLGLLAGCNEQSPETTTRSRTASPTTTDSSTDPRSSTPEETPNNTVCDREWDTDNRWTFGGEQDVKAVTAGSEAVFAVTGQAAVRLDPATGEQLWRTDSETLDEWVGETWGLRQLRSVGNRLLAVDYRGVLALDTGTGEPQWAFTVPGKKPTAGLMNTAGVAGETLYVGAVNQDTASFEAETPYSRLYAIESSTGESRIIREFTAEGSSDPIPRRLSVTERGLFCLLDGQLVGLNLDGTTRWGPQPTGSGFVAPAVAGNSVLAAGSAGLAAYHTADGRLRWSDDELGEAVTVTDETGYAVAEAGLTAFDPATGDHYWEAEAGDSEIAPAVADGSVFHVDEENDQLVAFDAEKGCRLGAFAYPSGTSRKLAAGAGRISMVGDEWQADPLRSLELP